VRVLFTVSDWPTHWYPLVPLAWALQAAGEEVLVVCPPGQAEGIRAAGLTPAPTVAPALDLMAQARLSDLREVLAGRGVPGRAVLDPLSGETLVDPAEFDVAGFRATWRPHLLRTTAAALEAAVETGTTWRPDLVVHERMSLEGPLVAGVLGVPAVLHSWGPVGTAEADPRLRLAPGDATGAFARHGLAPWRPDRVTDVLDPCPAPLEPPVHGRRWRVRPVPYDGGGVVPDLPAPRRPRVCVVWGRSMTPLTGSGTPVLSAVVDAVQAVGGEAVLLGADDVEAPSTAVRLGTAPLAPVLAGCAAVVHGGGNGSTMTSIACGVPQVALPHQVETRVLSERVATTGASTVLSPEGSELTARCRDALQHVLSDPAPTLAATALQRAGRERPTPADLVPRLRDLARRDAAVAA
jgi:hypothetical protein